MYLLTTFIKRASFTTQYALKLYISGVITKINTACNEMVKENNTMYNF